MIKFFLLQALGIEHSKIHIAETATDKVPNTMPTAASMGSDVNGMAVLEACQTIMARLEPFRTENPSGEVKSINRIFLNQIYN